MYIGVPTEIKNHEYRVGLTPDSVRELTAHGHQLLVQSGAGSAIGFSDEHYREAGARLVSREQVFSDRHPQPMHPSSRSRRSPWHPRSTRVVRRSEEHTSELQSH